MAPKKEKKEPEPEKKLSRGDVDELIDDGTALLDTRDWAPALATLEAAAEGLEESRDLEPCARPRAPTPDALSDAGRKLRSRSGSPRSAIRGHAAPAHRNHPR